eukprot:716464-Hanusia_phi.AAC.1
MARKKESGILYSSPTWCDQCWNPLMVFPSLNHGILRGNSAAVFCGDGPAAEDARAVPGWDVRAAFAELGLSIAVSFCSSLVAET